MMNEKKLLERLAAAGPAECKKIVTKLIKLKKKGKR